VPKLAAYTHAYQPERCVQRLSKSGRVELMSRLSCCLALLVTCSALVTEVTPAQTTTVIPANEVAAHVGQYATVEGVVAKVFTSDKGNTFLNIGHTYPNQSFTGWIPPASAVNKSPMLSGIEGKHVKITGRIEMYKGKPEIRINAASQLQIE
jgi:hypothetical protein